MFSFIFEGKYFIVVSTVYLILYMVFRIIKETEMYNTG